MSGIKIRRWSIASALALTQARKLSRSGPGWSRRGVSTVWNSGRSSKLRGSMGSSTLAPRNHWRHSHGEIVNSTDSAARKFSGRTRSSRRARAAAKNSASASCAEPGQAQGGGGAVQGAAGRDVPGDRWLGEQKDEVEGAVDRVGRGQRDAQLAAALGGGEVEAAVHGGDDEREAGEVPGLGRAGLGGGELGEQLLGAEALGVRGGGEADEPLLEEAAAVVVVGDGGEQAGEAAGVWRVDQLGLRPYQAALTFCRRRRLAEVAQLEGEGERGGAGVGEQDRVLADRELARALPAGLVLGAVVDGRVAAGAVNSTMRGVASERVSAQLRPGLMVVSDAGGGVGDRRTSAGTGSQAGSSGAPVVGAVVGSAVVGSAVVVALVVVGRGRVGGGGGVGVAAGAGEQRGEQGGQAGAAGGGWMSRGTGVG
ncbi:MAG: hypothetical protein V9E96_07315 [Chitinophagaceae bacterium]